MPDPGDAAELAAADALLQSALAGLLGNPQIGTTYATADLVAKAFEVTEAAMDLRTSRWGVT